MYFEQPLILPALVFVKLTDKIRPENHIDAQSKTGFNISLIILMIFMNDKITEILNAIVNCNKHIMMLYSHTEYVVPKCIVF